jgi:hypothetical protein
MTVLTGMLRRAAVPAHLLRLCLVAFDRVDMRARCHRADSGNDATSITVTVAFAVTSGPSSLHAASRGASGVVRLRLTIAHGSSSVAACRRRLPLGVAALLTSLGGSCVKLEHARRW